MPKSVRLNDANRGLDEQKAYDIKKEIEKQEMDLLRRQQGIDPLTLIEIIDTQARVKAIKEIMDKGRLQLNSLGFFGLLGDKYIPVGFNPWRDTDGKMDIGKLTDMTDLKIEGTDTVAKPICGACGNELILDFVEKSCLHPQK